MARNKGFMLAMMEPPPALEEEFNAWYDTEHLPERAAIKGFESVSRYVCVDGWPRYVALYELEHPEVLDGAAYRAIAEGSFSPWSRRMRAKVWGQYRAAGVQIYPGQALTGTFARMLLVRFRDAQAGAEAEILDGLRSTFGARPETSQVRLLRSDTDGRTDYIGLIEAQAPYVDARLDLSAFGGSRSNLDMVNTYVPYWQRRVAGA